MGCLGWGPAGQDQGGPAGEGLRPGGPGLQGRAVGKAAPAAPPSALSPSVDRALDMEEVGFGLLPEVQAVVRVASQGLTAEWRWD